MLSMLQMSFEDVTLDRIKFRAILKSLWKANVVDSWQ